MTEEFKIIYSEDIELDDEEIERLAKEYEIESDGGIDNVDN